MNNRRPLSTFASLAHPNYRLWFGGQLVSLFGTWMQATAQGYLVFELTRSAAWLGYVAFASGVASWMFTLHGGVVADRTSRRKVLLVAQFAAMGLAITLAVLTFTGVVNRWHVLALSFLLGVVNAYDGPARQSFVVEMVDRDDLTNAIALNAMVFNAATALGPAFGGLIYAEVGPGWCFTVNAASFLGVIGALLLMRLPSAPGASGSSPARGHIVRGFEAIRADRRIQALIATVAATTFFSVSFVTLLPAFAVNVLGGDARTNGFLQSGRGVGAVVAALVIASYGHAVPRGRAMTFATFAVPTCILCAAATRTLPASLATMFLLGVSFISVFNLANALVQSVVPDEVRGRVMAVYNLAFLGVLPVGSLVVGALAHAVGEPLAGVVFAVGGLACAALVALVVPSVRRMG